METQSSPTHYGIPPSLSSFTDHSLSAGVLSPNSSMDTELIKQDYDRSQRAASVLSGMSTEDIEAAETLNSLFTSECPCGRNFLHSPIPCLTRSCTEAHPPPQPPNQRAPPTHVQTTTAFDSNEPEPLLSLITSAHPLAAPLIHSSLSAYKTAQSYIPGAQWTERNVGLPLAGTIGRVTGMESGLRWALQRRDSPAQSQTQSAQTIASDLEKGFSDAVSGSHHRGSSDVSFETLPPYNPGDRSPPYTEHQVDLQTEQRQPPAGWRQQLMISTSGLGVAMSEESLRSLRYCLRWLRWANDRLGMAVQNLRDLLQKWNESPNEQVQAHQQPMSVAAITQSSEGSHQAALAARIAELKADVLRTLKHVVVVVSNYAGGALPENARNLVHRQLTSLPQRFSIAAARPSNQNNAGNGNETASNAQRVLVLAQEGLDMMSQVSGVVNDTLVSAESWCEKLGRRRRGEPLAPQQEELHGEKDEPRGRSVTMEREGDMDTKMEM